MSILVHPDKNQDDAERAQQAFESIYQFLFHRMINIQFINIICLIIYKCYLFDYISC